MNMELPVWQRAVGALTLAGLMATDGFADGEPVFHLDFSVLADRSGNDLEVEGGDAVSLVPGGGPTLSGGRQLSSGFWEGVEDETNQILLLDAPILDAVSTSAGSIVTWIRPEDGSEWNNIAKTVCPDGVEPCDAFGEFLGIEFQASGPHAGVFGAVQGWNTNVFGPNSPVGDPTHTDTPTGEWTHAALTWNAGGDHSIYVNGVPGERVIGVGAGATFGANNPGGWTIGGDGLGAHAQNSDPLRYLHGQLADFAIYNGELSAAEIMEIMANGVQPELAPIAPGDFNEDGVVDVTDFHILSDNLAEGTTFGQGDFNGDRIVDLDDFGAFKAAFHEGQGAVAGVPEPTTLTLVFMTLLLVPFISVCATRRPAYRL
jgi:Concanavalin A-like lectin/glucanases superfamily